MALSVVSQWIQKRLSPVLRNVTQVPSTRLPMCKEGNNQRVQLAIKLTCKEIIYQAVISSGCPNDSNRVTPLLSPRLVMLFHILMICFENFISTCGVHWEFILVSISFSNVIECKYIIGNSALFNLIVVVFYR